MRLTICPTFDSIHSWLMKSFIIKKTKPNHTTIWESLTRLPLAELITGNHCKLTLF